MALPTGQSPGATARALAATNASNAPGGGFLGDWSGGDLPLGMSDIDIRLENTIGDPSTVYVGETALPVGSERDLASHYYVSQQLADRFGTLPAALGGVTQEFLNRAGGSPGGFSLDDLAANYAGLAGATPEQAARAGFYEHTEPGITGLGQGTISGNWDKIRALHEGSFPLVRQAVDWLGNLIPGAEAQEGPSAQELSDIEAFGDPRGILDQAVMANILGLTDAPAIHPSGLVNIQRGGPISTTNVYGQERVERPGGYYNFPIQQAPMGTSDAYAVPNIPLTNIPIRQFEPLQRQRELLDKLFASGVMSAPGGYFSPVDVHAAGQLPGTEMSSDTFGYQAGLKGALAKQMNPLIGIPAYLYKQAQDVQPENVTDAQWELIKETKEANVDRALEAYEAGQEIGYTQPSISFPVAGAETLTARGSTYDPALGGDSPLYEGGGITEIQPGTRGLAEAEMDLTDPSIPGSTYFQTPTAEESRKFFLDRQFGTGTETRAPMVDTFEPPEPPYMTPVTNVEAMASDVQRALDRAGRIDIPTGPITANDWFARPETQLQALTELAQTDPTIAERYTTPGSQDLIDIATQVESFSAIQERADQERVERERADNRRAADEAAARQEQVRADNQRRADEAREAQDRARENRERQEEQAERARAIAERSKAADDRKSAARAQARADAAAQRERQAAIQRKESQKRKQATERAAANQRRAAQKREQAARAKEAAARAQQQSRAQAAAAAARARAQAAARARNIAAENRLRSTMGGTNYAAYLRRGK